MVFMSFMVEALTTTWTFGPLDDIVPPVSAPSVERRKHPRFAAAGRLAGHLVERNLPVRVRDIGLGGFSVETMEPLPAGGEHKVRFISHDDWSTILPAKLANCRPSCADDGSPLFVSGFAFLNDETPETKRTVAVLLEKVTVVDLYGQA